MRRVDQDGIDPGDSLSPLHTRKATVFYWSFADFGHTALQQEQAWFPVALALQSHLRNAVDGIGQLAALVVRELHARFGAGVGVDFNDGDHVTIWAKVHMMVADEPALKEMTSCKGHAGVKPCALCLNVVQDTQRVPGQPTRPGLWNYDATLCSLADPDFSRCRFTTCVDMHARSLARSRSQSRAPIVHARALAISVASFLSVATLPLTRDFPGSEDA